MKPSIFPSWMASIRKGVWGTMGGGTRVDSPMERLSPISSHFEATIGGGGMHIQPHFADVITLWGTIYNVNEGTQTEKHQTFLSNAKTNVISSSTFLLWTIWLQLWCWICSAHIEYAHIEGCLDQLYCNAFLWIENGIIINLLQHFD